MTGAVDANTDKSAQPQLHRQGNAEGSQTNKTKPPPLQPITTITSGTDQPSLTIIETTLTPIPQQDPTPINRSKNYNSTVSHNISSSRTYVKKCHFTHKWKIQDFSTQQELCGLTGSIESITFPIVDNDQHRFRLKLFPNGKDDDCPRYLSLSVFILRCPGSRLCFSVKLYIKTTDGRRGCVRNRNNVSVNEGGIFTANKLFSTNTLKQRASYFVPGDVLTVGIDLTVFENGSSVSVPTIPPTLTAYDTHTTNDTDEEKSAKKRLKSQPQSSNSQEQCQIQETIQPYTYTKRPRDSSVSGLRDYVPPMAIFTALNNLPKFSGTHGDNLAEDWIGTLGKEVAVHNVPNSHKWQMLACQLEGRAKQWIDTLTLAKKRKLVRTHTKLYWNFP